LAWAQRIRPFDGLAGRIHKSETEFIVLADRTAKSCRLFGANIKLAGSLSLAVSLPTMIVGFMRYSRDQSFSVIRAKYRFLLVMAMGSIVGAFIGGRLLGMVPTALLLPILTAILLISAVKVWCHE
jgi:uncharacterized membrane protein YfcA